MFGLQCTGVRPTNVILMDSQELLITTSKGILYLGPQGHPRHTDSSFIAW